MKVYKTKQDLIDEINKTYNLFIAEFAEINNKDIHERVIGIDKTPSEALAYQIGWLNLLLSWEKDELAGKKVETPAPNMKWNEIGKLHRRFYDAYKQLSLSELLKKFDSGKNDFVDWIGSLDEKVLFGENQRKWASSTPSKWLVWKWLHINSVAPFMSFRGKIRKWKKAKCISAV
ncbi:MAG: ClbS/DfsB family four-helix bundle protein [Helicobacteraceae bacterium]|jgi:hypothetical protein|nr:ClbS/DfsB family four-helix bundle protein [Helicobacteraceae bacterium]